MAFASGPSSLGFDAGASEVPRAFVRYIEDLVKALKSGHTAREDSGACRCLARLAVGAGGVYGPQIGRAGHCFSRARAEHRGG